MKTAGIIGGRGNMGRVFQDFLNARGFRVLIADVGTTMSNVEVAKESDLLVVSVPIPLTESIIAEVGPFLKKGALLIDLTSLKEAPLAAMKKYCAGDYLALHPMFGPANMKTGQTIVFCEGRGAEARKKMRALFFDFRIVEISAVEHDRAMAVIQALSHFSEATIAATMAESGVPMKTLLNLASPIYNLQIALVARVLGQRENLSSHIIFGSDSSRAAVSRFVGMAEKLEKGGIPFFEERFRKARAFLGDFCFTAKAESDEIIHELLRKQHSSSQRSPSRKKKDGDFGVLGPDFTWSDIAARRFFPTKKRRFFSSFSAIFSALKTGEVSAALLPLENKISGSVRPVWNAMRLGGFWISEVATLPVKHVLAAPFSTQNITSLFAHNESLSQCASFLAERYPEAILSAVSSNSEAVARAKSFPDAAAICSRAAAEKAGFFILHENIAEEKENATRFALLSCRKKKECFRGKEMTTITFRLIDKPGALLSILQIFKSFSRNIIHLESRPTGKRFSEYDFFLTFAGELSDVLFKNLQTATEWLKILGHFSVRTL